MESVGFAEIKLKLSGGILPVPISVTINSINQLALSAMGKYVYSYNLQRTYIRMYKQTFMHN